MKEIEDELTPITGELSDMSEVKLPAVNRKLASQNVRQNEKMTSLFKPLLLESQDQF